ncbi:conserved hypothetical protein [Candidatus Desulfarcum epimagneticum]|uniref:Methionine synthase n=1 Tax=uncultured Desulfobacteraceae bacterium TaxID=218296 RepID=A0A484HJA3_9BACT|nr:conserved hypothetical protein [uncultured Desulfobacteraceae bacterium]
MTPLFTGDGATALIGSMPLSDHAEALDHVFSHSPDIPSWVQLPRFSKEGMIPQFAPGLPGLLEKDGDFFVDSDSQGFSEALTAFYEDYLAVAEGGEFPENSRFALSPDSAEGFFLFLKRLSDPPQKPKAAKGQVTGPITLTTGIKDQTGRAIFYDPQLRDAAVKMLSMKAVWQTRRLLEASGGAPVIVFLDEPSLAGFGTSEHIAMSREETLECLKEVAGAVSAAGGIPGVHVCANTDWSIVLESGAVIVNFDAYAYFDRFVIYADSIKTFMESGGILAWGIVPTLRPEDIEKETARSLAESWMARAAQIEKTGLSRAAVLSGSLITPSCGTGSLEPAQALKVLELTRDVSKIIQNDYLD